MKIIISLMFVCMVSISATVFSQHQTYTLNLENISMRDLFKEIEKQSDYRFFYNDGIVDVDKTVNLKADYNTIDEILDELFTDTSLRYKKLDNHLIVVSSENLLQSISVSGVVKDVYGEPLPGVNIMIKGTTTGLVTDVDGNFSLTVPNSSSILVFSFIGFEDQEIQVGSNQFLNIIMKETNLELDEVVVVAYGTQKRKDLTGAISSIDNKLITTQSTSTVTKALEGAVPGLQVSSVDGQPGLDMAIRVRGLGSTNISSSGALVVIDGVPQNSDSGNGLNPLSSLNPADIASVTVLKDAASTALYGSRGANGVVMITTQRGQTAKPKVSFSGRWGVNSIGPFDVGKIDNAADYYEYAWQSIYNSYRYGVDGTGLPVNFSTNVKNPNYSHEEAALFASQHLFNYIGSESEFGRNMLGNYMAYSVPNATYTPTGTSSTMTGAYLVGPDGKINPDAVLLYKDNYSDYILENNFRQEYNVSLSGGTEKVNYFLSLGYLEDPSYIKTSKYSRYSGRSNVDVNPFKWLKLGANIAYSRSKTDKMSVKWGTRNAGANQGNLFRFINGHAPIVPVYAYNEDGSYHYNADTGTPYNSVQGSTYSPLGPTLQTYGSTDILYSMANDKNRDVADTWNTRLYTDVSFLNDFKFSVNFSYDKTNVSRTQYVNSKTGFGKNIGGMAITSMNWSVMNSQEILSYNKDIEKHTIEVMAAHEYNDWKYEMVRYGAGYELLPGFISSSNFVGKYTNVDGLGTPSYGKDIERMESYLGRLNYLYDEKYYLSGSIRTDGSSKFKKNRWGTFWSVGGGWRFSEELFMRSTKNWLDNGKIRASYGVIGNANAIGRYSGYSIWTYGSQYTQTSAGTGTPNGTYILTPGNFVNDALTWENTNTFDVGVDLSLIRRINFTFDYYNRYTKNSFFNQPVSYMATGQESLQLNGAGIRNKGIEIEISADVIRRKDFSWSIALNGTHYTTVLEKIPANSVSDVEGLPAGTWIANGDGWSAAGTSGVSNGGYYLRGVGRPWYNLYLYKYAGVDQESGLPMYWHRVSESEAGTGEYSNSRAGDDVKVLDYNQASKYEVGDAVPKFIGGFTTSVRYKDFDLSAVLAYQLGGKYYSVEYGNGMYRGSSGINAAGAVLSKDLIGNTWTPENTNAKYPMQWYAGTGEYYDGATFGSWMYTDMALFSASYLRVKNITFGYTLPKQLLSRAHINNLRVYLSGDNLFMFSAAKGVDPSMSLTGGMEVGAYTYPTMRTISLGINIDF